MGAHNNMHFISPAFTNPDGAWLGSPQAAVIGNLEGQKTIVLVELDRCIPTSSLAR